jgi:Geranylgeranyl pyrophosphate synthase
MDKLHQIKFPISEELEEFKELFDSSLSSSSPLLHEALAHIRQRNGKMMRPMLVLLIAKILGEVSSSTFHAAVALELLHTASLIHDDVVDESSERRGQASVNAIYNNKVSVLIGDYILATCLVQASLTSNREIIETVARLGQDLSEGELLQLSNVSNTEISESSYFDVISKKTAALFSTCTKAAALSVNASAEQVEIARLFGEYIGICFQIKDDVFDYFENKELGKPTSKDMSEGKLTLPVIFAINSAGNNAPLNLISKVKSGHATSDDISELVDFTKNNGGIEYATNMMYDYKVKAFKLLSGFEDSALKKSLIAYLDYVVDRVN